MPFINIKQRQFVIATKFGITNKNGWRKTALYKNNREISLGGAVI